ncbi:hypothetical protein JKP88DRAFT_298339 [Tribonema minus]|uniref:Trs120/TRAPPC9 N-terminal domain-containing protein n=1 Tax=Tribonema minus TaxID=303371 RepID=A0A835ZHG4_9STRA|nr:hypothetical protein JKP88DRAFT_298339 [Tribonema minus]
MSNVWVKQTLASHSKVQVLLVPLGGIPKDVYDRYCSLFKRLSAVPMQDLTAPGDWTRQNCPFRHFSWTEGAFHFHFVEDGTTDGGLSEWGDYQAHRRVYVALGIVHEPSCRRGDGDKIGADLSLLQAELALAVAPYPHATLQRIFVFEHSFEAGSIPGYDANRDIILPPEPEGEGGAELLRRFLAEPLHNIAVALITQIEGWVRAYAAALSGGVAGKLSQYMASARGGGGAGAASAGGDGALPPLRSPLDTDDDNPLANMGASSASLMSAASAVSLTGGGGKAADRARARRRWGRLRKWLGDLALLAGTPKDAVELYDAAAAELAKADPLWHAGALEGFAAALVALADDETPTAVPPEIFKLIAGREQEGGGAAALTRAGSLMGAAAGAAARRPP